MSNDTRTRQRPVHEKNVGQRASSDTYDGTVTLIEPKPDLPSWTFLTNHAHVMVALSRDPDLRQRDLSYVVGITPGAVQRILDDLEDCGYLRREKVGRRNHYEIIDRSPLRHPHEGKHTVGEMLDKLHDRRAPDDPLRSRSRSPGACDIALKKSTSSVEPGTLALLLKRVKATSRALAPGRHFMQPWRKAMVQVYPSRELMA